MNINKAMAKSEAIARWLRARDYCATDQITWDLIDAQKEIARITKKALRDTIARLDRYAEQAYIDSTDLDLSARERQKAQTELKRIKKLRREMMDGTQ
jgi:hypothetical protein